jgi:hypothetical protein
VRAPACGPGALGCPFAPYYPGTGEGFALESSDSSGEKDHDGPLGAVQRESLVIHYMTTCRSNQFESHQISWHLLAHWMLHMSFYTEGAVTKRLRSGCDCSSLPNYKSIPPTWAPNSWTDQIRSNTILVAPLIFALAISREAAGTSVSLAGLDWKCPTSSGDPSLASSSQRRLMSPDVSFFVFFLQSLRGFADIVPYNNAVMPNTLNP